MKSKIIVTMILGFLLICLTACSPPQEIAPPPSPTPTVVPTPTSAATPTTEPTPTPGSTLSKAERLEITEMVWQTVNDNFFDPTFGGKDWQAIGDQYRPQLIAEQSDEAFVRLLNEMLFELGVSHMAALPPDMLEQLEPISFASGAVGIDIRLLDDQYVITAVEPGSKAEKAGLRTGYIITAIDGIGVEAIADEPLNTPPFNERAVRGSKTQAVRTRLYGETGEPVTVDYLDEQDQTASVTLRYVAREGRKAEFVKSLPTATTEFESKWLDDRIGYIRFSGFAPAILETTLDAIDDMTDAEGLIIDLRGNPGGIFPVRKAIAEKLVGKRVLFWQYQHRDHLRKAYLDSVKNPYLGEVVILIDELSTSSSEEFSGGLQAIGRATIVGNHSPGRCLTANIVEMPGGGILVYANSQSQTTDGSVLEDNGVAPDLSIALDRDLLLQGRDVQLETAIEYLESATK